MHFSVQRRLARRRRQVCVRYAVYLFEASYLHIFCRTSGIRRNSVYMLNDDAPPHGPRKRLCKYVRSDVVINLYTYTHTQFHAAAMCTSGAGTVCVRCVFCECECRHKYPRGIYSASANIVVAALTLCNVAMLACIKCNAFTCTMRVESMRLHHHKIIHIESVYGTSVNEVLPHGCVRFAGVGARFIGAEIHFDGTHRSIGVFACASVCVCSTPTLAVCQRGSDSNHDGVCLHIEWSLSRPVIRG